MKIGLFGGSFDPPHNGHLTIATSFLKELQLDEVLFIPAYIAPQKGHRTYATAADRLNMLRLALAGHPHFRINTVEIEREGISYTIDTIRFLKAQEPQAEYYLLIGADSLLDFANWREPEAILNSVQVVIAKRPECDLDKVEPKFLQQVIVLKNQMSPISSSLVRNRVRQGQSLEGYVPQAIAQYITEHKLYR